MTMKRLLFFCTVLAISNLYSQNPQLPEGWDLITLEGKTAYMNLITGEVSLEYPKEPAKKPTIAKPVDPSIWHKVQKGETLFYIARKYAISVDDIYRQNTELTPTNLKVGQEIVVGYDKSKEGKVEYVVVEDMYTNPSNNNYHYVKKGETLFKIAKKHGISVSELKELNNLISNTIEIGQKLKIR